MSSRRTTASEPSSPPLRVSALPQRQSLVSTVVEQLSSQIASGAAAPGSRLPAENELCRLFDVSRTVVREALSQLKADGLVETLPGLGLYVARRPPGQGVLRLRAPAGSAIENARELLEFRAGLEAEAARLAALRRTDEDLGALRQALALLEQAERAGTNGGAEDLEFHMAIARASKNSYIVQVLQFLSGSLRDAISHSRDISATRSEFIEAVRCEHSLVLDAIVAGDAAGATLQMQRHLASGALRLLSGAPTDDGAAPRSGVRDHTNRPKRTGREAT